MGMPCIYIPTPFLLMSSKGDYIQTIGKKKTAVATAIISKGTGDIRLNGSPIELIKPEILRNKV